MRRGPSDAMSVEQSSLLKRRQPFQSGSGRSTASCWPLLVLSFAATTGLAHADITFAPSASVQANATDNVRRQASNQEGDVVFVTQAGVVVDADTLRLKFLGTGSLLYSAFVENSASNRLSGNLLANAVVNVVPDFLFIEGSAQISDEFLNVAGQSATGLPNGNAQARIFNYQLGSYIKTEVLGKADAILRGQMSAVQSDPLDGAASITALSDSIAYQASALITNGGRSHIAVWRLTAGYTLEERGNNQSFRSGDALLGVTVRVTPRIHAVGEVGYEDISGTTMDPINGTIWSAGVTYKIGEASTASADLRHRFGQDSWSGNLNLALSERLFLTASYEERLESQQLRLGRALTDVFGQQGNLPPPPVPVPVSLDEDLVDDLFYTKDANAGVVYKTFNRSFEISAQFSQREIQALNTSDETAGLTATYTETVLRDLLLDLSGTYDATLEARTGQVPTDRYTGSGGLNYRLNETTAAQFRYTWSRTDATDTISENVASAALTHAF